MVWETEPTFLVRDVAFSESKIPIRLPIWQDTIAAVGHYTVLREHDVTDQECELSFPDHLPRPRQDGGRKWAGDETTLQ